MITTLLLAGYLAGVVLLGGAAFILVAGFPSNAGDGWLAVKMAAYVLTWPVSIPLGLLVGLVRR